jgi:lantibiotic biosynthesis protein
LRINFNIHNSGTKDIAYAASWCHGAPGIGLSRLRALTILRTDEIHRDCEAAIRTSTVLVQQKRGTYNESNYSLCHGLTGICELLIYASQVFNNPSYKLLPIQIAMQGETNHINQNNPWPCGIPYGEPPGLMLGLAGIGYYYLRLYDPGRVPSILILLPE